MKKVTVKFDLEFTFDVTDLSNVMDENQIKEILSKDIDDLNLSSDVFDTCFQCYSLQDVNGTPISLVGVDIDPKKD